MTAPLKWGSRRCWAEWETPAVLHEGQRVRVFRWQAGVDDRDSRVLDWKAVHNPHGHWEEGVVQKVFVDQLRVAAVDLRAWWACHRKTLKSGRPPVGVKMRDNVYWLMLYRVEACDPKAPGDWPVDPTPPAGGVFDFGGTGGMP